MLSLLLSLFYTTAVYLDIVPCKNKVFRESSGKVGPEWTSHESLLNGVLLEILSVKVIFGLSGFHYRRRLSGLTSQCSCEGRTPAHGP